MQFGQRKNLDMFSSIRCINAMLSLCSDKYSFMIAIKSQCLSRLPSDDSGQELPWSTPNCFSISRQSSVQVTRESISISYVRMGVGQYCAAEGRKSYVKL